MKWMLSTVLASVALIAACATSKIGQDFKDTNIPLLQPGKTTLDQAVALLGAPPTSSVIGQSGAWGYTWTYIEANANSFSANSTAKSKSVMLVFSTDGTFQRIMSMSGFALAEADRKRLTIVPGKISSN